MKKLYRLLAVLLAAAMLFSLSGCTFLLLPFDWHYEKPQEEKNGPQYETAALHESVSYDTLEQTAWTKFGIKPSLPSVGDVNLLVIPIAFTNTQYKKYGTKDEIKNKLEIAFNGTDEQTGWHSLQSYYREVSYGKLNLQAKVMDVYETGEAYDMRSGEFGEDDCRYLIDALDYYDDQINYSVYDQNDDGAIDCVYLVYLAPYQKMEGETDLWWAYFYSYYGDERKFDGVTTCDYLWFSIEFFSDPIWERYRGSHTDKAYVEINCETVIHETGHALGLDDYYDYEEGGVTGGVGSFAMMDANQGDHDPYSKAILGWTNPTVIAGANYSTTLRSFTETGDTLVISKSDGGTYFEEYYVLALYTPTGVNELKKGYDCGLPKHSGVMLWHVDATLNDAIDLDEGETAIDITFYNNGWASRKLIDLVCANGSQKIDRTNDYVVSDKDLFTSISLITDLTWYDGTPVGVTVKIGRFTSQNGTEQTNVSIEYAATDKT